MFEYPFPFMPPDLSTHGGGIDAMIWWLHILMAILFVGWGAFFICTLVKFRAGKNPKADPEGTKSHFSTYHEVGIVVIECIILFALAIPLWANWVEVGRASHPPGAALEVNVIGQQFQWNIQYPGPDGRFGKLDAKQVDTQLNPIGLDANDPAGRDDIVTNQLLIPVDTPVVVNVTSMDVIHSFFIPVMRVKQDAVPGQSVPIGFQAKMTTMAFKKEEYARDPAKYDALRASDPRGANAPAVGPWWVPDHELACAQLCGKQHYAMIGKFYILGKEDFADLRTNADIGAWGRRFRGGAWNELKER
jgi:cytochrome c oxidase subunit 2